MEKAAAGRLPALRGHTEVRADLARAHRAHHLPGSLLLHGPRGIGKQRLGLWLAQLLVCTAPPADEPCGACQPCRLVLSLGHPDVHWFFPLPRPKVSGGPEKLADALEDARSEELAARRAEPHRATLPGELAGLYLAQVQTLRRLASRRPALGGRAIFLIGDAELLVPQESSPEAANALLKVLEEPPPDATFLLTAADPDALLPTLRSRLLPVRLRPLARDEVVRFLADTRSVSPAEAEHVARLAEGSIGRALGFLSDGDGEPGPLEALRREARGLLEAAAAPSARPRLALAHARAPTGARGSFGDLLGFLALWLRDLALTAAGGQDDLIVNAGDRAFLADLVRRCPSAATGAAPAIRKIDEARGWARFNVNPQLTLAWLLREIHQTLTDPA